MASLRSALPVLLQKVVYAGEFIRRQKLVPLVPDLPRTGGHSQEEPDEHLGYDLLGAVLGNVGVLNVRDPGEIDFAGFEVGAGEPCDFKGSAWSVAVSTLCTTEMNV